jgi:hypothetical protein
LTGFLAKDLAKRALDIVMGRRKWMLWRKAVLQ